MNIVVLAVIIVVLLVVIAVCMIMMQKDGGQSYEEYDKPAKSNRSAAQNIQVRNNRSEVQNTQVRNNRSEAQNTQVRNNRSEAQNTQVRNDRSEAQNTQVRSDRSAVENQPVNTNRPAAKNTYGDNLQPTLDPIPYDPERESSEKYDPFTTMAAGDLPEQEMQPKAMKYDVYGTASAATTSTEIPDSNADFASEIQDRSFSAATIYDQDSSYETSGSYAGYGTDAENATAEVSTEKASAEASSTETAHAKVSFMESASAEASSTESASAKDSFIESVSAEVSSAESAFSGATSTESSVLSAVHTAPDLSDDLESHVKLVDFSFADEEENAEAESEDFDAFRTVISPTSGMRESTERHAKKFILTDPDTNKHYEAVCTDTITIGRRPQCGIRIQGDNTVSGVHCEVSCRDDGNLWIRDCNSSNGTYLNGMKLISERILRNGDILEIGHIHYYVGIAEV